MPAPVRLGLTGGIGSGKSTVAGLLVGLGAGLVDADAISRQLTIAGGLAMSAIAATFGSDFVDASGALARDRMRQLVHTDASARIRLEAIIHPLVGQESRRQAALLAEQAYPCIVFDVPLLVESAHWRGDLDHVLVVDCTTEKQIDRVMARNQLSRAEVEKIIASQASRRLRLEAADSVIFNVGLSLDELAVELQQISARFGLSSG
ncbi:MAG: dephospho-CoA kinase [Comamonadaceae bacterium]|nr:MAG: dephospho-CoA kinase [Comamonadaceae bacterium]